MVPKALRSLAIASLAIGAFYLLGEIFGLWGYAGYIGMILAAAGGGALLLLRVSPRFGPLLGAMALAAGVWVVWIDPILGYRQYDETRDGELILTELILSDGRRQRDTIVRLLPTGPSWHVSISPQTPCDLPVPGSKKVKVVVVERTHWGKRVSYGPAALVDSTGRRFHCIRGKGEIR